jgi:hypothetical protein
MIPTTTYIRFATDGTAHVEAALRLTASSHVRCCTYGDHPAIVLVDDAHVSVSLTVPDSAQVTVDDLDAAVHLAEAIADYIADLRRWMAAQGGAVDAA